LQLQRTDKGGIGSVLLHTFWPRPDACLGDQEGQVIMPTKIINPGTGGSGKKPTGGKNPTGGPGPKKKK
jgi:hypothetical protein